MTINLIYQYSFKCCDCGIDSGVKCYKPEPIDLDNVDQEFHYCLECFNKIEDKIVTIDLNLKQFTALKILINNEISRSKISPENYLEFLLELLETLKDSE